MCGFMFAQGVVDQTLFQKGFDTIAHRGPDQSRVLTENFGTFGFHRLSIMDISENGMQPFVTPDYILMCNGEIYNEQQLKKSFASYPFFSRSDCETILPLYNKYGRYMCKYLDAEFAFVLYDKNKQLTLAARDPIGIRPMFYGEIKGSKNLAFASEAKSLIPLCDNIQPFPIGTLYYGGEWIKYNDITQTAEKLSDMDDILTRININLTEAVKKRMMSDVPIGYLLSGGLDSSLVCALAAKYADTPITTFAVGMKSDAIDLKYARMVAKKINSRHYEAIMTIEDVISALPYVIYHLESYDITTVRASIGMYLLCKYIHQHSEIKVLLTGEISDELFGYKYTDFAPDADAFMEESKKRMRELYMYDVLRADRCIAAWSLEARVPFGDLTFVRDVMAIDGKLKMNTTGKGKYLLRKAFEDEDLLPTEILWREKAAFSDAVGHSMVDELKKAADRLYSDEDVKKAKEKYPHCTPFTKEALWYRDIFEKFYPQQAHLITTYWMPNPTWDGCNVSDPSARVLTNYGDSGK
jgi:asparagine synthase (glutamine-hydrolysing)